MKDIFYTFKKLIFVTPIILAGCSTSPNYETLNEISSLEQEIENHKYIISCLEDVNTVLQEDLADIKNDVETIKSDLDISAYWVSVDFPDDYDELEVLYNDANTMYEAINQAVLEMEEAIEIKNWFLDEDWNGYSWNYCN